MPGGTASSSRLQASSSSEAQRGGMAAAQQCGVSSPRAHVCERTPRSAPRVLTPRHRPVLLTCSFGTRNGDTAAALLAAPDPSVAPLRRCAALISPPVLCPLLMSPPLRCRGGGGDREGGRRGLGGRRDTWPLAVPGLMFDAGAGGTWGGEGGLLSSERLCPRDGQRDSRVGTDGQRVQPWEGGGSGRGGTPEGQGLNGCRQSGGRQLEPPLGGCD